MSVRKIVPFGLVLIGLCVGAFAYVRYSYERSALTRAHEAEVATLGPGESADSSEHDNKQFDVLFDALLLGGAGGLIFVLGGLLCIGSVFTNALASRGYR